jgi:very-short-patch-repair endonuclease
MIRTRTQLLAQGVAASTLDYRCRSGEYTRLLPSIYAVGTPTALARCEAILTWIPEAVLSHRTAAWLHGMLPELEPVYEASVPKSLRRKTPPWLRLYRREVPPEWIGEAYGLPVMGRAATLLDCVSVMSEDAAGLLIDSTLVRMVSPTELMAVCQFGKRGSPALRKQLRNAALWVASEPERRFARAMAARRVRMLANHSVGPFRCDFVHERSGTIVEIDGREFHSEAQVFRDDRRRQNSLQLEGWLVLRYAAADIFTALDACADEAAEVIRRRARLGGTRRICPGAGG